MAGFAIVYVSLLKQFRERVPFQSKLSATRLIADKLNIFEGKRGISGETVHAHVRYEFAPEANPH